MPDPIKGLRWVPFLGLILLAVTVLGTPLSPFEKLARLIRHGRWYLP